MSAISADSHCDRLRAARVWLGATVFALLASLAANRPANAQQPAASSPAPKLSPAEIQAKSKEFKTCLADTIRFRDAGKLDDAIIAGKKLLEDARELLGDDNPLVLKPMEILAIEYQMKEDFTNAESMRREILAKAQSLRKLKKIGLWQVNDASAGLRETLFLKDLDPAKRRELADAEKLSEKSQELSTRGKFAEALALANRASETIKTIEGQNCRRYVSSLLRVALVYDAMGDYAKAAEIDQQAAAIDRIVVGTIHPDYATCEGNLAENYRKMGDYSLAIKCATIARNTRRYTLGTGDPLYAISMNNLGILYMDMGDYSGAEPLLREALIVYRAKLGEKSEQYASCLSNLGLLYTAWKNYSKAELNYKLALAIEKDLLGDTSPTYATTLYNLARLYEEMGEDAMAEPLCRQACNIGRRTLGESHPTYAKFLSVLAIADYDLGKFDETESIFKQSLAIQKKSLGENHIEYAAALSNLATVEAAMGHFSDAAQQARQALDIARNRLEQTAPAGSERQQLAMQNAVSFYLNSYLSFAAAAGVPAETVYAEVLSWKGEVTAREEMLHRLRDVFRAKGLTGPLWLLDQLADVSRKLANESMLKPQPGAEASHRLKLNDLTVKEEASERALAADVQRYASGSFSRPSINAQDVRLAMPDDTALVDFLQYMRWSRPSKIGRDVWEPRLAVFVVRPGKSVQWIDLGPRKDIDDGIAAWRKTFGLPGAKGSDPGQDLRRLVWQKIEPALDGARTILISPDGATAQFPFSALPGRKPGTYLIEERAIAIMPIPRDLLDLAAPPAPSPRGPASLLAVGGVDFGADPGRGTQLAMDRGDNVKDGAYHWQPLPGTVAEIAAVTAAFEEDHPKIVPLELSGAAATKDAVLADLAKCRYVHFATHGYFTSQSNSAGMVPTGWESLIAIEIFNDTTSGNGDLTSGLVLAGANRAAGNTDDNGILTAFEVSQLDLQNVELATLSACETGLGKTFEGDGVFGLQRAFQIAGAKSVVASLWKVPDKATEMLMARFYSNLWEKKMPKLAALREAQLWLLHEGPKQQGIARGLELSPEETAQANATTKTLPPYFWAAFVLSGDWR